MKYIVLIQANAAVRELYAGFTDEERAAAFQSYFDIEAELQASGELIESKALDDHVQRIVTRGDAGPIVTDAPLAEVTELVSGFYLVEVADEARAVEIGVRFPEAAVGAIRVARTLTAEDFAAYPTSSSM
jgi:hypothetical protein